MAETPLSSRISHLDTTLFETIPTQVYAPDKKSLLGVQRAVRRLKQYSYLEIGSYLGGTLQTHLKDPRCKRIYSIDTRVSVQKDQTGVSQTFFNNTTKNMLANLRQVSLSLSKIRCFESDASEINRKKITQHPDICYIDGNHNYDAVLSDFSFCREVSRDSGVIIFHDSPLVFRGIQMAKRTLDKEGQVYRSYALPLLLYVIELGEATLLDDSFVRRRRIPSRIADPLLSSVCLLLRWRIITRIFYALHLKQHNM